MAVWHKPNVGEEIVFGPAGSPIVWTNLDLTTSITPAATGLTGTVLVLLRVVAGTGIPLVTFRRKNDGSNYLSTGGGGHGCEQCAPTAATVQNHFVLVTTDAAGLVEWRTNVAQVVTISIEGWASINIVNTNIFPNGVVAAAWATLDTLIGDRGFSFLRTTCTANPEDYAVRPKDLGAPPGPDYLPNGRIGGCSHGVHSTTRSEGLACETDASGLLEHRSLTGVLTEIVDLLAYAVEGSGWTHIGLDAFPLGTPPLAYTSLDISSLIGNVQTGVLLHVHREPAVGAGATTELAFRPGGDATNTQGAAGWGCGCQWLSLDADEHGVVFVETNAVGVFEWWASNNTREIEIEVLGIFNEAPTVTGTNPVPASTVGILANVAFTTSDDFDVDSATIDLALTDPSMAVHNAIINGVFQPGYNGTIVANGSNGFDVILSTHPPFAAGAWSAEAICDDYAGAIGSDIWAWTVDPPPTVNGNGPVGTVEPDVTLTFECSDNTSVVAGSITLDLTDPSMAVHNAIIAGAFQPGYTGTIVANGTNGFDITLTTHPYWEEGAWSATATVQDGYSSPGSDTWGWTVEWVPRIVSAHAIERRKLIATFDMTLRLKTSGFLEPEPADRYTPLDWIAAGGAASDALNPANYVITRPSGGNLDGPEEAVDLTAIQCEQPETGTSVVSGFLVCDQVVVVVDYNMTAHADYRVVVSNVMHTTGVIDPATDTEDFVGRVVSQVPRSSLRLFDILPAIAQRLDAAGTGDLELFCGCLQESYDRIIEDTDSFFNELCSLDYIRADFIDALLYDLGDQFSEIFDLTSAEKRRLAGSLVKMYRLKGTCTGITQVIDFFLGITIQGCRSGWDDCWRLAKGSYPAPVYPHVGETYPLYKGAYPAPVGGAAILGPTGVSIWNFWLLHVAPGTLTADQLAKIAAIVNLWKPAYAHYLGVTTP